MQGVSKIKILLITTLFSLSGCGSYGSSFSCQDASGLDCLPLSIVDQKINSREIVKVELNNQAKCQGRSCHISNLVKKPDIKADKAHKIKLHQQTDQPVRKDGNLLYIK